jgi:hypothetical protein
MSADNHGKKRYRIRKAAGLYWLIDLDQKRGCYRRPLPFNETGALIWERIEKGDPKEEIVCFIRERYGIGQDEAKNDVSEFLEQLKKNGITVGDTEDNYEHIVSRRAGKPDESISEQTE